MSEDLYTIEPAQHKENCEYWHLMLVNCFRCGAKGKVNV